MNCTQSSAGSEIHMTNKWNRLKNSRWRILSNYFKSSIRDTFFDTFYNCLMIGLGNIPFSRHYKFHCFNNLCNLSLYMNS